MKNADELDSPRPTGSAFRRVGVTVAVACVLTGSIVALGSMGALAVSPNPPTASVRAAEAAQPVEPKITYSAADLAAFAESSYVDDALNLAVVWGIDPDTAKGMAGAKLRTGVALPFAPGEAASITYSSDQQRNAFFLTESDFTQALGLAFAENTSPDSQVPAAPATFTEEQDAAAFTLAGYTDADAARLAALWQSQSAHSAQVRAGAELLAGKGLQL
jgi:hypothetical protein